MRAFLKKVVVWILTLEARLVLKKYKPRIIGVTGSVGKTSTKDVIFTVLSHSFYVRKSQKSFNSELGVPLTILGLENAWANPFLWMKNFFQGLALIFLPNHYPKWLVLEIGLDRPGDIARIVRWLPLDVAVFTRFARVPVHVEFFESPEALLAEKRKLGMAVKPDGVLVVNEDDPLQEPLRSVREVRVISYGMSEHVAVCGSHHAVIYENGLPKGINFKISASGGTVPVNLHGVLGVSHVYPFVAAAAVAHSQGMNLVEIADTVSTHEHAPGRMRILPGWNGAVLIDDTYNASPIAAHAALDALAELQITGRKIAVLADMTELGKFTVEEHRAVGRRVREVCDILVTVGQRAGFIADGARAAGMLEESLIECHSPHEAAGFVRARCARGDVVLIKGSQSMRMERATAELLLHPEQKKNLLVRQDREWLKRQ